MSEFQSDIKDKKVYDDEGHELDKHGFMVKRYPDGLELWVLLLATSRMSM